MNVFQKIAKKLFKKAVKKSVEAGNWFRLVTRRKRS